MIRLFMFLCAAAIVTMAVRAPAQAQERREPGVFDYYLLTLSWSPTYCAGHPEPAAREECGPRRSFIVHGLWPQDESGKWPEYCRTVPPVPPEIVARERASMPNATMIEHEWERHGSCTTLPAEGYFAEIDRAFAGVRIPEPLRHPEAPVSLARERVKALFATANPGLEPGMMALQCRPGGQIEEMRICLDTGLHFRPCGNGEPDRCPDTVQFPAPPIR